MKRTFLFILAVSAALGMVSCAGKAESSSSALDTTTTTTTTAATSAVTTTTAAKPAAPKYKYDPEAKETVIELDDPDTEEWKNPMYDDYIDGHSFPSNSEVTVTVDISLTEDTLSKKDKSHQIAFAPCYADSWDKIGAEPQMIRGDFPNGADLLHSGLANKDYQLVKDDEGKVSEDVFRRSDPTLMAELFVKPDGFIKFSPEVWTTWKAEENHTVTFILSTDAVNRMKEEGTGLLFQCSGGFKLNKITFSCGNILTHEQYVEWQESAGADAVWG